jgi:hypothetical protein
MCPTLALDTLNSERKTYQYSEKQEPKIQVGILQNSKNHPMNDPGTVKNIETRKN